MWHLVLILKSGQVEVIERERLRDVADVIAATNVTDVVLMQILRKPEEVVRYAN